MPAKTKVSSWLSSATPDDSGDNDGQDVKGATGNAGDRDDEEESDDEDGGQGGPRDWEQVLRNAKQRLFEGKVGRRIQFMQEELRVSPTSQCFYLLLDRTHIDRRLDPLQTLRPSTRTN